MKRAAILFLVLRSALEFSAAAVPADPAQERQISSAETAPLTRRNPVLLIHGIKDDARKMEPLARFLRAEGWDARTMSYRPSWGQKGLDELALQVAAFIDQNFAPDQKIDLVAFSMGGLVTRYYLQRLGGIERAGRFVTISTPHRGTLLAWLLPNPGCRQMRPGSAFLRDLESDADRLAALDFTSLWTPLDLIVLPPRSSEIAAARSVKIWSALHPFMVLEKRCHRAVASALSAGSVTAPPVTRPF